VQVRQFVKWPDRAPELAFIVQHCVNPSLQVEGLPFVLEPAHRKMRRDGYRK
jgi:hypothetical protein